MSEPPKEPVATARPISSDARVEALEKTLAKMVKTQTKTQRDEILTKMETQQKGLKEKFKGKSLEQLENIMEGMNLSPNAKQFGQGKSDAQGKTGRIEIFNWNTKKYEYQ